MSDRIDKNNISSEGTLNIKSIPKTSFPAGNYNLTVRLIGNSYLPGPLILWDFLVFSNSLIRDFCVRGKWFWCQKEFIKTNKH